jgi:hypothetical protein
MRLSKIFEHLTHNTLSNLSIGHDDIGEVAPDKYPKLITLVNAGMIDLYTRFALRTRDITLQLSDGQNIYPLTTDYAESNLQSVETKYILDGTSVYSFNDDIISIDEVYNEIGDLVPLNNLNDSTSVFTPSPSVIQVPYTDRENVLILVYRALPDDISVGVIDPSQEEVELPMHFLEAITSFVAWKMYTPIDGADNPKGRIHQGNYLAAIQLIERTNTGIEDIFTNTRFEDNGWL